MPKPTNTRYDICGSKPMSPRRLSQAPIDRRTRKITTSGRRFTSTSASRLQLRRPRKRRLDARRQASAGRKPEPAVRNNSRDDNRLEELRRMTWIKTVRMDEDDRVKNAIEAQRKLYPIAYATTVHPVNDGPLYGLVTRQTLQPDAPFPTF